MTGPTETRDLFYPQTPSATLYAGKSARIIGRDLEAEILVASTGSVIARLSDDETFLINSTLDAYAESLRLVGEFRDAIVAGTVEGGDTEVDALEGLLSGLDPEAWNAADSYWPGVVEQIRFEQF